MTITKYSKYKLISLCAITYFASYFSRKNFAAIMVGMLNDNILDKSTAGFIGMSLFICYGFGQLISGYLGDKVNPKLLLAIGLFVSGSCNLLMAFVPSSFMILVWGFNGLAQALFWPPILKLLAENLNNEDYVTANFVVTSAAHLSTIFLYLYVPICLKYMSWESVFISSFILCMVTFVLFIIAMIFILPSSPTTNDEPKQTENTVMTQSLKDAFTKGGIVFAFLAIIAMGFLRDGIESWLPTLYSEAFERDSAESILVSVIMPIFSILSLSVITVLRKKTKVFKNEIAGALILFIFCSLICTVSGLIIGKNHLFFRTVCLVFAAFACASMHSCNFMLISCLPGRFKKTGRTSTVSGLCNACTYIGAAASMYGIAIVSDKFGWKITIFSWVGVALFGAVICIAYIKKYKKYLQEVEEC